MATTTVITTIRHNALRSLIPPPRLQLSQWIEASIRLPEGVSALPGAVRLWPYQRDIADAISDPGFERVTLVKAARLGFTTLLSGAVGAFVPFRFIARVLNAGHCPGNTASTATALYFYSGNRP